MLDYSLVFKALSDKNRLKMLGHLCSKDCECSVNEVASCCEVDLSVISRNLKILKSAGILSSTKKGKKVMYQVNRQEVAALLREVASQIEYENCCITNSACCEKKEKKHER